MKKYIIFAGILISTLLSSIALSAGFTYQGLLVNTNGVLAPGTSSSLFKSNAPAIVSAVKYNFLETNTWNTFLATLPSGGIIAFPDLYNYSATNLTSQASAIVGANDTNETARAIAAFAPTGTVASANQLVNGTQSASIPTAPGPTLNVYGGSGISMLAFISLSGVRTNWISFNLASGDFHFYNSFYGDATIHAGSIYTSGSYYGDVGGLSGILPLAVDISQATNSGLVRTITSTNISFVATVNANGSTNLTGTLTNTPGATITGTVPTAALPSLAASQVTNFNSSVAAENAATGVTTNGIGSLNGFGTNTTLVSPTLNGTNTLINGTSEPILRANSANNNAFAVQNIGNNGFSASTFRDINGLELGAIGSRNTNSTGGDLWNDEIYIEITGQYLPGTGYVTNQGVTRNFAIVMGNPFNGDRHYEKFWTNCYIAQYDTGPVGNAVNVFDLTNDIDYFGMPHFKANGYNANPAGILTSDATLAVNASTQKITGTTNFVFDLLNNQFAFGTNDVAAGARMNLVGKLIIGDYLDSAGRANALNGYSQLIVHTNGNMMALVWANVIGCQLSITNDGFSSTYSLAIRAKDAGGVIPFEAALDGSGNARSAGIFTANKGFVSTISNAAPVFPITLTANVSSVTMWTNFYTDAIMVNFSGAIGATVGIGSLTNGVLCGTSFGSWPTATTSGLVPLRINEIIAITNTTQPTTIVGKMYP